MNKHLQSGFTLVELMVAMTLSLILMAGVLSIFFSSKVSYLSNEKTARLQENGRVALDMITYDIRSAGYPGCAKPVGATAFKSSLNSPTAALWDYRFPMQGYESNGAGAYSPALVGITLNPGAAADSDILVLHTLKRDSGMAQLVGDMASVIANPVVNLTADQASDQLMLITNCSSSSVFQLTAAVAAGNNVALPHAAAGSNPGNSTNSLGYAYTLDSKVLPIETIIYYVGVDAGVPGLYRRVGNSANSELLIEGVQALQLAYGEDTTGNQVASRYVAANAVGNWNTVVSVSLSLLVRSDATGTDIDRASYSLLTPTITAMGGKVLGPYNDRRQRMVFATTAAVRNRAL